nr:retrotransposon Orf1 [Tanacetum cinerariifolium]
MTNKIDIVLKAITDQIAGALPNDTVKNLKLGATLVLSTCSYPTKDLQCSTHIHSSINTITIHPKQPKESQVNEPDVGQEEKGNFTYVIDFMIVEDISSIIDPRLSRVVLGRPFIEVSNMTHGLPKRVVRFTNENDEVAYKMPHKIKQYNSLSNLEKEHIKSVYLRNEEDKKRGVDYPTRGDAPNLEATLYDIAHYMSKVPFDRITEFKTAQRQLDAGSLVASGERAGLADRVRSQGRENLRIRMDLDDTQRRLRRLESLVERRLGFRHWVELLAKIATNSALSKQLLKDDVTEDNMNERLGMLLLRKRRELAEQRSTFRPKPTLDAPSAKRANQGVPQVLATSSQVPAVPSSADVSISAATTPEVPAAESCPTDTLTASVHVSVEHSIAASTHSSSRRRRKHIAKKQVTPIVDIADATLIKFDSDSGSDDDPLPYAPYAGWKMVPSLLETAGTVDNLYQQEDPDTFLWGDLHVLFQSLDDKDARDFWRNQDSWRIRSWHLYPRAQVHILETVNGRVIYMFVDVSYPLSAATFERMLKHGLEVPKLLVGGDLTMAEQLISFIKVALLNAQYVV